MTQKNQWLMCLEVYKVFSKSVFQGEIKSDVCILAR